jgi:hypothetical protein
MSSPTKPPITSLTCSDFLDLRYKFAGKLSLPGNTWATVAFRHIKLRKIKGFGFYHILAVTRGGVPKEYVRWGYIELNSGDFYRTSVVTIRELQDFLGDACQIDQKETVSAQGNGKKFSAFNWHMSIKAPGPITANE